MKGPLEAKWQLTSYKKIKQFYKVMCLIRPDNLLFGQCLFEMAHLRTNKTSSLRLLVTWFLKKCAKMAVGFALLVASLGFAPTLSDRLKIKKLFQREHQTAYLLIHSLSGRLSFTDFVWTRSIFIVLILNHFSLICLSLPWNFLWTDFVAGMLEIDSTITTYSSGWEKGTSFWENLLD